jgi:hypothetical protein
MEPKLIPPEQVLLSQIIEKTYRHIPDNDTREAFYADLIGAFERRADWSVCWESMCGLDNAFKSAWEKRGQS